MLLGDSDPEGGPGVCSLQVQGFYFPNAFNSRSVDWEELLPLLLVTEYQERKRAGWGMGGGKREERR